MALLNEVFTIDSAPVQTTNYDVLPAGLYDANIASAELKDTRSGGKYINVRYDITGPTHIGRVVFGMINISNPNPKAEEIGRQQLAQLIQAIGLDKISDTDQLIGGNLKINLKVESTEQYGEQNRVTGYRVATNKPTSSAAPATNTPPWAKK